MFRFAPFAILLTVTAFAQEPKKPSCPCKQVDPYFPASCCDEYYTYKDLLELAFDTNPAKTWIANGEPVVLHQELFLAVGGTGQESIPTSPIYRNQGKPGREHIVIQRGTFYSDGSLATSLETSFDGERSDFSNQQPARKDPARELLKKLEEAQKVNQGQQECRTTSTLTSTSTSIATSTRITRHKVTHAISRIKNTPKYKTSSGVKKPETTAAPVTTAPVKKIDPATLPRFLYAYFEGCKTELIEATSVDIQLHLIAEYLEENPSKTVVLTGNNGVTGVRSYFDGSKFGTGPAVWNQKDKDCEGYSTGTLMLARAGAIRDLLVRKGVSPARIQLAKGSRLRGEENRTVTVDYR